MVFELCIVPRRFIKINLFKVRSHGITKGQSQGNRRCVSKALEGPHGVGGNRDPTQMPSGKVDPAAAKFMLQGPSLHSPS